MRYYLLRFFRIILIAAPFYLVFRRPRARMAAGKSVLPRELAVACFVLFHAGLLALALEGEYDSPVRMAGRAAERLASGEGINLVPFRTIRSFFFNGNENFCFNADAFMVNIIGNVVMFMPWGFGIVLLWNSRRGMLSAAAYSLLLPLFIETSQLFIGRSVDVDDVILNFIGSCLGAGGCFLLKKTAAGRRFQGNRQEFGESRL